MIKFDMTAMATTMCYFTSILLFYRPFTYTLQEWQLGNYFIYFLEPTEPPCCRSHLTTISRSSQRLLRLIHSRLVLVLECLLFEEPIA